MMSFAGTVFDMIRRNKENRELLNLRRQRMNDLRTKTNRGTPLHAVPVTPEELEKIKREIREKEKEERKYYLSATLVLLGIGTAVAVVLALLFF